MFEKTQVIESSRPSSSREWQLLEKLLLSTQNENRKARRWGIFFKALTFAYLFALLYFMLQGPGQTPPVVHKEHTALVEVNGVIAVNTEASADYLVTGLREAFEAENAKAVILRINSPGGSPVQAGYVYDEIQRLKKKNPDKKVYAVISDIGASGGYYIAAAADEIYADKASIVGSIGVIMNGFGFEEAIKKLGIERRVMTAGENKAMMDPFSPVDPKQKAHVQAMLDDIHQQFIQAVKQGRGERLSEDPAIFSGLFWTGEQAQQLGLVDGLGSASYVAREIVGFREIVDYTPRRNPLEDMLERFGVKIGEGIGQTLGRGVMTLQ